jgi:hypothetical protein
MKDPLIEEMDEAQTHALDCALQIFSPRMLKALIERIPEPHFEFQDHYSIEALYQTVVDLGTTAELVRFTNDVGTLNDAMVIAWAMHSVIQQIKECKVNRQETHFARYKDLLSRPSAWQVCLFGLQGLKAYWRG